MADRNRALLAFILIAGLSGTLATHAEDGSQGWLRYAPPSPGGIPAIDPAMPASIVNLDSSAPSISAQNEILRGVRSMLGRTLRIEPKITHEDAWVLGTTEELHAAFPQYRAPSLDPEGFSITPLETQGHRDQVADARLVVDHQHSRRFSHGPTSRNAIFPGHPVDIL